MKILPNGNIEISVQLMPTAYAALTEVKNRDKFSTTDAVNLALLTLDTVSQEAANAGKPLSGAQPTCVGRDMDCGRALPCPDQPELTSCALCGQPLAADNCPDVCSCGARPNSIEGGTDHA